MSTRVLRARAQLVETPPDQRTSTKRKTREASDTQWPSQPSERTHTEEPKTKVPKRRKKDTLLHEFVDDGSDRGHDRPEQTARATQQANGDKKADTTATTDAQPHSSDDKGYWLMKAEQEDREVQVKSGATINTKFTIEDLKARGEPEPWDGVRNFVARNNMRSMKTGDLAFFYASGGTGKNKPGITGIMTVAKEHEPDWTMYDEGAYGYVEPDQRGPDHEPKWSLVHVNFKEQLTTPVTLAELRAHSQRGRPLADMQLLRNGRISVSRVSAAEWKFITEELMGGQ